MKTIGVWIYQAVGFTVQLLGTIMLAVIVVFAGMAALIPATRAERSTVWSALQAENRQGLMADMMNGERNLSVIQEDHWAHSTAKVRVTQRDNEVTTYSLLQIHGGEWVLFSRD